MENANDIAWKLARAYKQADPERAHISEPGGDQIKTLIIRSDISCFRVTVTEIDCIHDVTEEEEYRPLMTTDPNHGFGTYRHHPNATLPSTLSQ